MPVLVGLVLFLVSPVWMYFVAKYATLGIISGATNAPQLLRKILQCRNSNSNDE